MKKISLLLSIFAIAIVSCSKDEVTAPAPAPVLGVLPTRIENISEGDGNSTANLTYNGNKIVEYSEPRNSVVYKTVFTYNGDLIVKGESFKGSVLEDSDEYIYENNKIKTILSLENRIDYQTNLPYVEKTKKVYTYNTNGTILEEQFKLVDGVYENQNRTKLFTYNSTGNLIKSEENSRSSYFNGTTDVVTTSNYTYTYEYDNKNNPLKNITGLNKIGFSDTFSVNNVIKKTSTFSSTNDGVINPNPQPARVSEYVLLYNANDYLTENKYSYNSAVYPPGGGTPTIVIKTNITRYFYD